MSHTRIRFLHPRSRPQLGQRSNLCLSHNLETAELNLMKLHRKIKHNEKVCDAQDLGFYTQGQGHNQVRGQIVPKMVSQQSRVRHQAFCIPICK